MGKQQRPYGGRGLVISRPEQSTTPRQIICNLFETTLMGKSLNNGEIAETKGWGSYPGLGMKSAFPPNFYAYIPFMYVPAN